MERFNSFSSDQIVLTKRQASMVMASIVLFCLFVFILGFFLGKRATLDDFSEKTTKQALNDQIDFLLTTQSLESSQDETLATIDVEPSQEQAIISSSDTKNKKESMFPEELDVSLSFDNSQDQDIEESIKIIGDDKSSKLLERGFKKSYAQLVGFGTKKAAQAFVNRLKKNNVSVVLKTMMSKSASGKQRTWYQAITPTYNSTQELQLQVDKIKRLEHIRDKDIKIMHTK